MFELTIIMIILIDVKKECEISLKIGNDRDYSEITENGLISINCYAYRIKKVKIRGNKLILILKPLK